MTRHVVGEVQARLWPSTAINGEDYSYNNRKMGGFAKCQAGAMGPLKIPSAAIAGACYADSRVDKMREMSHKTRCYKNKTKKIM